MIVLGVIVGAILWMRLRGRCGGKQNKVERFLNTFNGRLSLDDQYYYDKLFDDVFYYPNTDPFGKDMVTGWEKCRTENKTGHCVEFGLTGATYSFSY